MTFSWKKKKTRFSQLVADHLQSPKRGGSLVVETGFPTSLIDLYVRNRGRFRQFSGEKRRADDVIGNVNDDVNGMVSCVSEIEEEISARIGNLSEIDEGLDVKIGNSSKIDEDLGVKIRSSGKIDEYLGVKIGNSSKTDEDLCVKIGNSSKIEEKQGVERSNLGGIEEEIGRLNGVFLGALKVLFMVILALGAKRFTIGITVSAFLLFFLESVVKPLMCRLSLRYNPKTSFESFRHKENSSLVLCNQVLEIKEVDSIEDITSEKEELNEVLMEVKSKSSRKAKMKSTIKKLVPKKLRTSKKSFLDSKGEIFLNQDRKPQSHSLVDSKERSSSKGETKHEHDKVVEAELQSLSSEIVCNDTELKREMQANSGYLVLCLVVLVGLVVGRILALVLAFSWCLMLPKIQRRTVKVDLIS